MTRAGAERAPRIVVLGALAATMIACGASPARPPAAPPSPGTERELRQMDGRPPLAVVAREGDPRGAVAIAVTTQGIAPERGAEVPVALAALVEARLAEAAIAGASVLPSADGFRARGLAADGAGAAALVSALRAALFAPVAAGDLVPIHRKLAMLARRPLADAALEPSATCEATVVAPAGTHGDGSGGSAGVSVETVESWRRAAVGLGRVSIAVAGVDSLADAVAKALAAGAAWPDASSIAPDAALASDARVYDATGDISAGAARVTLAAHAARAEDAVRAAEALGDAGGALAARLGGLDAPAKLRDVIATAHARGGCIVVSFDFAARDLAVDAAARIATAIALARQEIATELAPTRSGPPVAGPLARRARDPRDAADLAAWWALSAPDPAASGEVHIATAVGLATGRELTSPLRGAAAPADNAAVTSKGDAIRSELDRAIVGWHEPVVESRTRVERGQGDLWVAVGSPCGTLAEMESDAGLGAAFAIAAAGRTSAALRGTGASADAWAGPDGIGVVVHGPALAGESPEGQARRLADAVARAYAAEPVDRAAVSHARARLLGEDAREDARALVTLADAVAPGHPSWIAPMGPADALGRSSDASVAARASALRAGPLRVAVVGNASRAQTDAAVSAVDRWVVRHPGQSRGCPVPSVPPSPHPATYAIDAPPGGSSEAWLALALPPGDKGAALDAEWIAAALDGADGLLAHALGGGLARGWSARVVGGAHAAALVVRVDTAAGALDAAVAQVRALLDRLRQGSLTDADLTHAAAGIAERELATALDPARRILALWREPSASLASAAPAPPTLDALRLFASATLHDDALVIVAARPPRPPLERPDRPAAPPKPS